MGVVTLSFRDRFYSGSVAHAVTSPSAIVALGCGAAVGLLVAPVGVPLGIVGALVGGAIGYGGRVALALPRNQPKARIDAFSVDEPWRTSVVGALRAQARFDEAVRTLKPGPLRDRLTEIGTHIAEAVDECWQVAQRGQVVAKARAGISDSSVRTDLTRITAAMAPGGSGTETQRATVTSLQAQLATAARMDALIAHTHDKLDLLDARLDESVTQAIELSVSNEAGGLDPLGDDVAKIVDDLSSLRVAIDDVDHADPDEPVAMPGPAASDAPPPLPPEPSDGSRAAPSP